ncbi:hypothetical protein TSA6c_17315 [Azospirillum sp. TSA6c]|uniref:hypothetical protein n=1 Tax=Azospirillum sp. TSA6c TaxID=709813 RepID=UPI000D6151F9|nr:hypothetical protein [Azospirillum sp. TSA6c]PWC48182.1 hypothetical protein TSA6c_17315 [Azospirillum sp. TSA6c]
MDGLHAALPADDDPLSGWQTNRDLLTMLHIDNGMSFANIALLIAEGTGSIIAPDDVKTACIAVGIVAAPAQRHGAADKPARPGRKAPAVDVPAVDPHEPVGCRWITGDIRETWSYCQAQQREGSSYCEHHHRKSRATRATLEEVQRRADEARLKREATSQALKVN